MYEHDRVAPKTPNIRQNGTAVFGALDERIRKDRKDFPDRSLSSACVKHQSHSAMENTDFKGACSQPPILDYSNLEADKNTGLDPLTISNLIADKDKENCGTWDNNNACHGYHTPSHRILTLPRALGRGHFTRIALCRHGNGIWISENVVLTARLTNMCPCNRVVPA